MNITCPRCDFSRELPADRLPSKPVIATCPHCACRFRLTPGSGLLEVLPDKAPAASSGGRSEPSPLDAGFAGHAPAGRAGADTEDDPLPPGATVPGRARENRGGESSFREPVFPGADPAESGNGADKYAPNQRPVLGLGRAEPGGTREAPRLEDDEAPSRMSSQADGNPWEHAPEPDGWFAAFYQTCMRVMFAAHNFFSQLKPGMPQMRPLAFYLVISVVQVVLERAWSGMFLSLMAPSAATDPQLEAMLTMLSPQLSMPMTLLLKTGVSVVQLYVLSALLHFTYGFIVRKQADFSLLFQVTAYAAAPALLCVVPLLGSLAGFIWTFACMLVGCRAALRLTWGQTLMGFAPVVLLLAPLVLQLLQTARM